MPDPKELLSSAEFAKRAGVSSSTVSKWLRSEKIQGNKHNGKWMISVDQLPPPDASKTEAKQTKTVGINIDKKKAPTSGKKATADAYTIEAFSEMTYLTPFGVERFLREGRLSGFKSASGDWQVDGANLEKADILRLLRK